MKLYRNKLKNIEKYLDLYVKRTEKVPNNFRCLLYYVYVHLIFL